MLFNAKHFEQFFDEKILKKGLHLFLKSQVEPIVMQSSPEFVFLINANELSVKTKGDKILSFNCSCKSDKYCSHLCAALFYMQRDTFDLKLKKRSNEKVQKIGVNSLKESEQVIRRRKSEIEKLTSFIEKQKKQVFVWELLPLLTEKSPLNQYDLYCLLLDHIIEPYRTKDKLGIKELELLQKCLFSFLDKSKSKLPKDQFYLYLATVSSFITLFNLRYSSDETKLFSLYNMACKELDIYSMKGLSILQEEAWHSAIMKAVETNKSLGSGVFESLIPAWVSVAKNKQKLWQLGQILQKRNLKVSYAQRLNKVLICRLMIFLREAKVFKSSLPLIGGEDSVEIVIAKAELNFFSAKTTKGFEILEAHYDEIKKNKPQYYQEYLDYILSKAEHNSRTDIEIHYLREGFINGLFIIPEKLEYFLQLIPINNRKSEISDLLKHLKRNPFNYSFDKVHVLLWQDERWDELITEIKKHKNKFLLLHETVLKKLPEYSPQLLGIYSKHLIASILEKEFYPYQIQLINKAIDYLKQLPEKETPSFMQTVLNGLLKQSQIYRYIKQHYHLDGY